MEYSQHQEIKVEDQVISVTREAYLIFSTSYFSGNFFIGVDMFDGVLGWVMRASIEVSSVFTHRTVVTMSNQAPSVVLATLR